MLGICTTPSLSIHPLALLLLLLLFNRSVVSDSLWPHGLQHARPPCPSPTPGVCSNSCPLSQWCHPAISSSVVPFSSCLESFPASGSFPVSRLFTSGGQRIAASESVPPVDLQGWFPLGLTGGISLQFKGTPRVFSRTTVGRHQFFSAQPSLRSSSHIHTADVVFSPLGHLVHTCSERVQLTCSETLIPLLSL